MAGFRRGARHLSGFTNVSRSLVPPVTSPLPTPRWSNRLFSVFTLTPSSRTAQEVDAQALEVLAEVIGGGATSYLYRKLVLDQSVAVNASAWYMASAMEETRFSLYAISAEGVSPETLEAAIDNAIAKLANEAFSEQAIEQAKTRLIAETVYSSDSQSSMARTFGAGLAIGETIADIMRWPRDIEAVTREELQSVAARFLTLNRSVTGYLIKQTD